MRREARLDRQKRPLLPPRRRIREAVTTQLVHNSREGVVELLHDGKQLFRYVYDVSGVDLYESPKPYFHPVRTLAGNEVTIFRPHDHVWHKGIQMTLTDVGGANFWGGPTYV